MHFFGEWPIYCLQDVHFTKDQEQIIKKQWGYDQCYMTTYKSNARGTATLFNNNFEFQVVDNIIDNESGNYVVTHVKGHLKLILRL